MASRLARDISLLKNQGRLPVSPRTADRALAGRSRRSTIDKIKAAAERLRAERREERQRKREERELAERRKRERSKPTTPASAPPPAPPPPPETGDLVTRDKRGPLAWMTAAGFPVIRDMSALGRGLRSLGWTGPYHVSSDKGDLESLIRRADLIGQVGVAFFVGNPDGSWSAGYMQDTQSANLPDDVAEGDDD